MRMLLCTNGSEDSQVALRIGVRLAILLSLPVTVLGVVDVPARRAVVRAQIDSAAALLTEAGIDSEVQLIAGDALRIIPGVATEGDFLTVLGGLGIPWWRRILRGPTLRHIVQSLTGPVLCAYRAREPESLQRILICSGGLSQANAAVHLGGQIAAIAKASVVLLHIATPYPHMPEPVRNVPGPVDEYLESDVLFSRNLQQELDDLNQMGVAVDFRLRSGDPLIEIMNEIRTESYDMVVIGSHAALNGPAYLVGDITHRIVEGSRLPVLVVTGHHSAESDG